MAQHRIFRTAGLTALGLALALTGLSASTPAAEADRGWSPGVESWVTDFATGQRLSPQARLSWRRGPSRTIDTITVDPNRRYQQMTGFGASMTDSSAYLLTEKLSTRTRARTMRELFSPRRGIGLSVLRQPMGASDFAVAGAYSYDDQPAGQTDPDLADFSIAHDEAYILPRLREAYRLNPGLSFMASPWSAPGWMKTSGSLVKGSLKPEYEAAYAAYFAKFIAAYRAAGIPTDFVTINNEPLYEPEDYPGMYVLPDQAVRFIAGYLGPELQRQGLAATTQILGYDHNWDVPVYPESLAVQPASAPYVPGTAWHCYAGDVVSQSVSHNHFPRTQSFLTECSGGSWQADPFEATMSSVIGGPRNWGQSVVLWNLALDDRRGPYLGGCTTCRGVVTVHDDGTVTKNVEYYALGHAAKFVRPGAVRIGSSALGSSDAELATSGVSNVAYANPDGSQVLVAYNAGARAKTFAIGVGDRLVDVRLAAGAAATYRWRAPAQTPRQTAADLGYLDLDFGPGPAGTPNGRLTQTVTGDVVDALTQVKLGNRWLGYSVPAGGSVQRTGTATTLPRDGWTLSADGVEPVPADPLGNALDGDLGTRWTSGTGQTRAMSLTLDLGRRQTFGEIELNPGANVSGFLRRYVIETSRDGRTWTDIAHGPGTAGVLTVALPPTTTRYLRIRSDGQAVIPWSVAELDLHSVAAAPTPPVTPGTGLVQRGGRLPDGTQVAGWLNLGTTPAEVPWPLAGFAYRLSVPPTAGTTTTLR